MLKPSLSLAPTSPSAWDRLGAGEGKGELVTRPGHFVFQGHVVDGHKLEVRISERATK